jgi:hypothetical protein
LNSNLQFVILWLYAILLPLSYRYLNSYLIHELVGLSVNKINDESANGKERVASLTAPPLKTLEDILHNRIIQKKQKIHKTQSIADTERLWTQIDRYRHCDGP